MDREIFNIFDKNWAVLTAGNGFFFNMMTISWGSLGSMWGPPNMGRPIATVYVKPIRYTTEYLDSSDYFTICFFPEKYRQDLTILGTVSGREVDKLGLTRLSVEYLDEGIGYREAHTIMICRKLYSQDMDLQHIPYDIAGDFYKKEPPHRMYIGEVEEIIER